MATDEYKRTEKWLYRYKDLPSAIRQYNLQIEAVKNDIRGCGAIKYDSDRLSQSYNISKSVENEVILREKKIEELESKKRVLEIHKEKLDIAINNFNHEQTEIFKYVYLKVKPEWTVRRIVRELAISQSTFYRIKKELVHSAINSMNPDRTLDFIENQFKVKEKCK
ncbi:MULTISPECIES: hypothetical protein [Peptostreptococcus]|uniref:hypothetical protein n=1 Tax=Peptostreptococcus TaxID=1257 RepID=UPI00189C20D8|nr:MULTISPECIES: hypothetical protein [Peptostreptococcus]MDB8821397.1 hypothetical protein [Peptostreptococcus anaerobius]MDB8825957.1 hypothetical protein [Peptostreptococcus anaerobius]MDB8827882.1 hypothetical protein [Peptostreptococcus anaerobius]MDB8829700.1 hypothetical protein [Peptostreptococcus anaerobius]MDB8831562.1 hypothetical protein [Peptostreptococcus anaerobius]